MTNPSFILLTQKPGDTTDRENVFNLLTSKYIYCVFRMILVIVLLGNQEMDTGTSHKY